MKKQLQIQEVRKTTRRILLMRIFFVAALANFAAFATYAQSISGFVKDDNGITLPGVNVLEVGTTNGTTTDADGKYIIKLKNDNATVSFSFIGFKTHEVQANGNTLLDVVMIPDIKSLNEVVVVGYGTQREREVTGAIGSITSKDISRVTVTGLDQALQGKIAGVQVTQNTGEPGGNVSVRIRGVGSINGSNEPLYIVDGVPYGNLNSINPNDIDRIDVLKDAASCAIYGSRGTNGVVIVTTKRAKAGKTNVTFDAYVGVQNAYRKLDLLNGTQFATLANENIANANAERTADGKPANQLLKANPAWSNPATVPNIDWQDAVLQSAPIQNYNVSISGGNDKSRSLLSFGYFDQSGITKPSAFKRYTARLTTDYDLTNKLKVGITVNGSFEQKNSVISVDGVNTGYFGALTSSARMHPTALVKTDKTGFFGLNTDGSYNTDSTYFGYEGYSFPSKNSGLGGANSYLPGGLSNTPYLYERSKKNIGKSQQFLAAAFVEYEIITGLKARSAINYTVGNTYNTDFQRESPEEIQARGNNPTISMFTESSGGSTSLNWINTLSYAKSIGDHHISAVIGTDAIHYANRFTYVVTSGGLPTQQYINASQFNTRTTYGNPANGTLASYIGRLTYDFKGKYLFNANVRRDGSSNFGPKHKYGNFPSASVGWRISEEAFMQDIAVISDLKLRGSYGSVGNQGIPPFQYLSSFGNDGGNRQYTLGQGQVAVNAVYPYNFGVKNISWEKSTMANIGIDATFLNERFTLTTDYYIKKISDMLGEFPVPYYTGITGGRITRNGFSMENRGFEITLGYNQQIRQVKFSANGNFATLHNEVTKLTDNPKGFIAMDISAGSGDGSAITRTAVGDRIGAFYGYVTDGIIQNQAELEASGMDLAITKVGDRKFKDLDGNRKIDANDRALIGNGLPKYTYGFSLKTEYKGFDLSVLLNGQAGVQNANQMRYWTHHMRFDIIQGGITNGSTDLLNSWRGEGSGNELPRNSYDASPNNRLFSTFNIENGAFLRVRNVQLGYTIPQAIAAKAGMISARIYIAAQNLFTFTRYTGYDPEIGSINQNVLRTGVDYGRYPVSRMFTGGVNIQF